MIKYKIFNKQTGENITDKYDWVIRPDGELYLRERGALIRYSNAEVYYILGEKVMDIWDAEKVFESMKEKSWKSYSGSGSRLIWLDDAINIVRKVIK